MMKNLDEHTKLMMASMQVDNLEKIFQGNQYSKYLNQYLTYIKYEIKRQLTNLNSSSKINE